MVLRGYHESGSFRHVKVGNIEYEGRNDNKNYINSFPVLYEVEDERYEYFKESPEHHQYADGRLSEFICGDLVEDNDVQVCTAHDSNAYNCIC